MFEARHKREQTTLLSKLPCIVILSWYFWIGKFIQYLLEVCQITFEGFMEDVLS